MLMLTVYFWNQLTRVVIFWFTNISTNCFSLHFVRLWKSTREGRINGIYGAYIPNSPRNGLYITMVYTTPKIADLLFHLPHYIPRVSYTKEPIVSVISRHQSRVNTLYSRKTDLFPCLRARHSLTLLMDSMTYSFSLTNASRWMLQDSTKRLEIWNTKQHSETAFRPFSRSRKVEVSGYSPAIIRLRRQFSFQKGINYKFSINDWVCTTIDTIQGKE